MTKRAVAMLMALVLVVGLLPMSVFAGTAEDRTKYEAQTTHTDAAHICEHCVAEGKSDADATVVWTAWGEGKTTLPTEAGHYYLTADLNVTAATITTGHVVLCLNGKTVTANGTANNAADRFYNVTKSGSLTIVDCTATGEGDSYKAGKLTGASNIGFNTNKSTNKSTGVITVYDGIFEKNVSKVTGNLFMIQGDADLYIYGGRFAQNEATGKGAGVVYGDAAANYVHLENAVFCNNTAGYGAVVYHTGSKSASVPVNMKVVNCVFDGNTTTGSTGAALCYGNNAGVEVEGCTFTNNTANTAGGAIRITGTTSSLTVKGSTFTGNTGKAGAGAIWAGGAVTLENVTIKNNVSKGTDIIGGKGAITLGDKDASTKTAQTLTIKGNTQISGNTDGADVQRNVHMTNGTDKIAVSGLAAAAKISVAGALDDVLTDAFADAESVKGNFTADDETLQVGVKDNKLVLELAPVQLKHTNAHDCEHCNDTITWTAWGEGKTALPTAAGHYYLTADLNVNTAEISSGHVVLCLNGKTVTANGTAGNANDRFYTLSGEGSLTIVDCTATGTGDDYQAGTFTGGSASAFMFKDATATTGTLNIYEGIFTGNKRSSAGGVICVQGKGKLNIYGGLFTGNNAGSNGGVIYLNTTNNTTYIENAVFKNNTATSSSGVLYNNKATVTLKNVVMTGNSAPSAGVITSLGKVVYDGVTITGNTTTSGSYGAIHHYNSSSTASVELRGNSVITGNIYGDPADGVERNLYLRNHSYKVYVNDADGNFYLTEGANIGLSFDAGKMTATNGNQYISSKLVGSGDPLKYLHCDNDTYKIVAQETSADGKRLMFAENVIQKDHPHKVCNDAACAEHAEIDFKNWTDGTSLPKSGNISLQTDVTLTAGVEVDGKLNICLNGHTITVNKASTRAFALGAGDELSITDCQGTGKITGGSRTYGGVANVGRGSVMNLFGGIITGNTATTASGSEGGAIYVAGGNDTTKNGAIFNMYGGEISNNTAQLGSAVRLTNPSGAGTKAQFNMYGGEITGNSNTGTTSSNYGVVNADKAIVKLLGGEISGNTSNRYGAVYVTTDTELTLGGDIKIQNNTVDGKAANLYLVGNAQFTVDGLTGDALVAVTAANFNRFISKTTASDCSGKFVSDSAYRVISYKDNALYLGSSTEHQHCLCAGTATTGCGHSNLVWSAWEATDSLPNADGNYYLINDVQLKDVQWIKNRNMNICLNGHTVTAADGKRLFSTQESTVMGLTDCVGTGKLTGGSSTFGGAIGIQAGSTLNLFGGIITGNQSTDATNGQGGAIYLQTNGTLNMYGGTITENTATLGGAIYGKGEAFVNVYGGVISNNEAASYGGAIYVRDGKSQINLGAVTIEGNHAITGGGAVYSTGANAVLNINGTTFKDNTIDGYGGGAIFAQSSGTKITIDGATFTGNEAQAGGALYAGANTTVTVDNSYFSGNTAKQGASIYEQRATVNIGKVTMEKNTATDKAAGIYVKAGTVVIDGAIIKNNVCSGSGTAITTGSDSVTVDGVATTVYPTVTFKSGEITGHKGNSGVILLQSKTQFTMSGGKISGNSCNYAGAIYVSTSATFTMTGGTISGNTAKTNGGGIYALRSTLYLRGGSITGNTATKMGGGVFISGSKLYLSGTYISNNQTTTGTGGGGIATGVANASGVKYESYIKMTGGAITNNYGRHGGAVLLQGSSKTVFDFSAGKITNNRGKVDGGAIYVSTNTTFNMTGGEISGNNCEGRAGAIMHQNSKGNYSGGEIFGNSTKNSGGTFLINGANCRITMKDIKIYDSQSGGSGGVICHQGKGKLTMAKVEIYNGQAGGAAGAVYVSNNTYLDVIDCYFHDTACTSNGGSMYLGNNTFITADGLTIENSKAGRGGGAIYSRSGNCVIKNAKIAYNQANTESGGGFCLYRPALQGVSGNGNYKTGNVFENVEFIGNTAAISGGAGYVDGGSKVTLTKVTMKDNSSAAEGGALWTAGDTCMTDLQATGNTSGGSGYAVYLAESKFDGHSYYTGLMEMGGDMRIEGNEGGDMFMGEKTTMSVTAAGLGQNTLVNVTIYSGVLTNVVYGEYHYEGGEQVYTITYGDRSLTQPEVDPGMKVAGGGIQLGNILLYCGVAVVAVLVVAVIVAALLLAKKKKAAPAAGNEAK